MNELGALAEDAAARYLQAQGLEIVDRNWRCRFGEIDLVARQGDVLVFVEVRARSGTAFGGAVASIDRRKRHKLAATAQLYLARHARDVPCRFDAVLVTHDAQIEWIRDAFRP